MRGLYEVSFVNPERRTLNAQHMNTSLLDDVLSTTESGWLCDVPKSIKRGGGKWDFKISQETPDELFYG